MAQEPATPLVRYRALVAAELSQGADPRVVAVAAAIAALYPRAARGVLFYGSCLRETRLDGLMLDFYLIVSDYRQAYGRGWFALANRLIPPNVFPFEHGGLAAKYAVLSEADFARLTGPGAGDVSVLARFAQPSRLIWAADEGARARITAAVAQAAPTLLALALPMRDEGQGACLDLWRTAFALTYATELRAERAGRGVSIVEADPDRYERFGEAALAEIERRRCRGEGPAPLTPAQARRRWRRFCRRGKLLTVLRLAKASTTFAGGIDYLAWKINRHAGTTIAISPWQRRHPLLAALTLLPRLLRGGSIR